MANFNRRVVTLTISLAVAVCAVSGCTSGPAPKENPEQLAKGFCWNAFSRPPVQRHLGTGSEVSTKVDTPFDLYHGAESRSCLIYVDGNTAFYASAERITTGATTLHKSVAWKTVTQHRKRSIDVGDAGAMADNSAVSAISCTPPGASRPSESLPNSEKYILLRVDLRESGKDARSARDLVSLMHEFVDFTRTSFECH